MILYSLTVIRRKYGLRIKIMVQYCQLYFLIRQKKSLYVNIIGVHKESIDDNRHVPQTLKFN